MSNEQCFFYAVHFFCTYFNVANNDGISIGVEEILALWITTEDDGLASLRSRQSGVN